MSADDLISSLGSLVAEWREMREKLAHSEALVDSMLADMLNLEARVRELEGGPVTPPEPPAEGLPLIPFACPPLLRNKGSWDDSDILALHEFSALKNAVTITIGNLEAQEKERVVRRDFGFQDPSLDPGRGGFLREPAGVWRRYELQVALPDPYDNRGEMCNLMQIHTDSTTDPPHIAFFLWTTRVYWRHNKPDGERVDYDMGPIRPGHAYKLAIEAKWSTGKDGELKAWQDGQIVLRKVGPNYPKGQKPGYFMCGPYCPSADKEFQNTFILSELKVGSL